MKIQLYHIISGVLMAMVVAGACTGQRTMAFRGKDIPASAIMDALNQGVTVNLHDKVIEGDILLFEGSNSFNKGKAAKIHTVRGSLSLTNCQINGSIRAYRREADHWKGVFFVGQLALEKCQIFGDLQLDNAQWVGDITLHECIIHQHFSAVSTQIQGSLWMEHNQIAGDLNVSELQTFGDLHLFRSEIGGIALCQRTWVGKDFQASSVVWNQYADFSQIQVMGGAYFNYGHFKGRVNFNNGHYRDRLEISQSQFDQGNSSHHICTTYGPVIGDNSGEVLPEFTFSCKS